MLGKIVSKAHCMRNLGGKRVKVIKTLATGTIEKIGLFEVRSKDYIFHSGEHKLHGDLKDDDCCKSNYHENGFIRAFNYPDAKYFFTYVLWE